MLFLLLCMIIHSSTGKLGGYHSSSGKISMISSIVQLRLKQSGMRWSVDGANYLITLRCMDESDNWNKIEKIVVDYFNK